MSDIIKVEADGTFHTDLADDNDLKCGTIVFSNNTRFRYVCVFCSNIYSKMRDFSRHILYDHLNYLDDYQMSDEEDSNGQKTTKIKHPFQETQSLVPEINAPPTKVNFIKHYESFVNDLGLVCVKTEICDDDEDEDDQSKEDEEHMELPVVDVKKTIFNASELRVPIQDGKQDILHIEIFDPPNEEECHLENLSPCNEVIVCENQTVISEENASQFFEEPQENANGNDSDNEDNQIEAVGKTDKTNKCPQCSKSFLSPMGVKRHITNSHGPKSAQYTCDKCGKCFRNETQLEIHIQRHLGIKPHTCEICGSSFADKSNLNVHVLRHKGIRPHKCTVCDKRFHSTTERKLHMRTHTGERPFVCELCGKKFTNSGHLTNHRRRHYGDRRFECDQCLKRFFDRKLLNDHKVMHTDERPFACDTCGATFQRRKALLQHTKLHSDLKQYVCKICGKKFAQNAGLYSHMKYH